MFEEFIIPQFQVQLGNHPINIVFDKPSGLIALTYHHPDINSYFIDYFDNYKYRVNFDKYKIHICYDGGEFVSYQYNTGYDLHNEPMLLEWIKSFNLTLPQGIE